MLTMDTPVTPVNQDINRSNQLTPSQQLRTHALWRRKCEIRFFMLMMSGVLAVAAYFLSFTWVKVMQNNDHLGILAISVETLVIASSIIMSLVRLARQESFWIAQYDISNQLEAVSNQLTTQADQIIAADPTKFLSLPSVIYESPVRTSETVRSHDLESQYGRDHVREGETKGYGEYDQQDDATQCMVCLAEFSQGDILTFLSCACAHRYHRSCLLMWLQRHDTCPLCNQSVTDTQSEQL